MNCIKYKYGVYLNCQINLFLCTLQKNTFIVPYGNNNY